MPRNKSKGNKVTKRGRSGSDEKRPESPFKEEDQEYMRVSSILGNCRMELEAQDGRKYMGIIRGKMRKRVYIKNRDLVLVSLRDFQDNKVDIIHKYGYSEILYLVRKHEIRNDFVDVDTMFSDNNTRVTRKRSDIEEIDLPGYDMEESDNRENVDTDDELVFDTQSESDVDIDDL